MKIETIEIAGLAGALTALRLPFGKEVRSKIENMTKDDFLDKLWDSAIGYDWKIQRLFYDLNENAYYCIVTLDKRK